MHRRPSSVARAAVSLATASRSLNGSNRTVNESYRARVLEAAARLNYSPNTSAQAVARGSTMTVALVVADVADPYFSSIAAGVVAAARDDGLIVTMTATDGDPERELQIVRTLRGQRPKVIILASSRRTNAQTAPLLQRELEDYERSGGRVVLISRNELGFRTVYIDNVAGGQALVGRLISLGYRSFAVLVSDHELHTADDRYRGFERGLALAGVRIDESHVVRGAFTRDGGYDGMRALLAKGVAGVGAARIDAVFAVNDVMAVGALTALREAGLVPGRDIAVAYFDDIPTVQDTWPTLTTVRVPLVEVGLTALRLALTDVVGDEPAIGVEVMVRDSTPGAE